MNITKLNRIEIALNNNGHHKNEYNKIKNIDYNKQIFLRV